VSEKWYEAYAKKNNLKINQEFEQMIVTGLETIKIREGKRYCPCRMERSIDTICPCKEMRETRHCHCGLFMEGGK